MKRTLSALCVMLLMTAVACKPTEQYIPEDKMESIMLDMQLAEVYGTMAGYDTALHVPMKNIDSIATFYRDVLAHHQVTIEQFKHSLDHYRQKPDRLDSMYVRIGTRLTKQARDLEQKNKAAVKH